MKKLGALSTVDKINIGSAIAGAGLGIIFVLPLMQKLFPGSLTAEIVAVAWSGGFGYFCGYLVSLAYVSRKLRNR